MSDVKFLVKKIGKNGGDFILRNVLIIPMAGYCQVVVMTDTR